ncbi:MAG: hypothetical protein M3680_13745 [Myxococcota bacterium]|nr:hypothetical protein [Myxococcota bacterium]
MARLLVDTDAFMKLGSIGVLEHAAELFDVSLEACERLPALPTMLRRGGVFKRYGPEVCARLVPLADTMSVATQPPVAWAARLAGVPHIDPGEVQLLALVAAEGAFLTTADKRALIAVSKVEGMAEALAGRIVSLEAVMLALCARLGTAQVGSLVRPRVLDANDQLLKISFSEGNPTPEVGLRSYFTRLQRDVAPLTLWQPPQEQPT